MDFIKNIELSNGMRLHMINSEKFKTTSIMIYLHGNIDDNAALNALVPSVLKRGNERFKSAVDMDIYLENMYGAAFDISVVKKGDIQSSMLIMQFISDRYAGEKILRKAIDMIRDILLLPYRIDTGFRKEDVEIEKQKHREIIKSRVNDKVHYAAEKCIEAMYQGQPFAIYRYGSIDDIDKIDEVICFQHYKRMLKTYPIDIFIIGDFNAYEAAEYIKEEFYIKDRCPNTLNGINIEKNVKSQKVINENMEVSQGRLCVGFRTGVDFTGNDYPALSAYASILGGGLNSRLFKALREKEGLAYYIYAGLEKFKGLMIINSGIEPNNYNKALTIIKQQIEDMEKDDISDDELDISKKSLESDLKSIGDNGQLMADYFLGGLLYNKVVSPDEMINMIKNVKIAQVKKAAQNIKLDTVYFLEPGYGG